jgi:hypothetical protein
VSAAYRASPRYGGVWAAFRAASPGLGPVGEIPRHGGSSPPVERAVSACVRRSSPHPASYRAPPRYRGVWAAFRAASPGSPPVGGVLPVGCLASSDGGGLVPGADPALVLPVGGLASSDGGGLVPGADPALGEEIST